MGKGERPGSPADSLCGPHEALQVQPQGSHGKVLQAPPPPRKLPFHLPSPGLISGGRWAEQAVAVAPPQARRAHLAVQAHEAQGVANTVHLVQHVGAEDHGREGDRDGAAAPGRDHLAQAPRLSAAWCHCLASGQLPAQPQLTICLGLMRYRWSEGTPSCSCRTTEMMCLAPSLSLVLLSACRQDVAEAHTGSGLWHRAPRLRPTQLCSQNGPLLGWRMTP